MSNIFFVELFMNHHMTVNKLRESTNILASLSDFLSQFYMKKIICLQVGLGSINLQARVENLEEGVHCDL